MNVFDYSKTPLIHNHSGRTELLCLLGSPVAHSISPAMHNLACSKLGLDYSYLAFDIDTTQLAQAVEALKLLGARGWNLTMPDKNLMCSLCDRLSPAARLSGAVNTVVNENGVLTGHTTDGIGYLRAAKDAGFVLAGSRITLLGAGGGAVSIVVQAALDGAAAVTVFNRSGANFQRMETILQTLRQETSCCLSLYQYEDDKRFRQELQNSDLLINATSVGMTPDVEGCLIPDASYFHPHLVVSDIIYHPKKTRLLAMAEQAGLKTFNGMYMLLYQGAEAFRLWTGQEMPIDIIKSSLTF